MHLKVACGTMSNRLPAIALKDKKSGELKTANRYSPTDLLVIGELPRQAFAEITELKQQTRERQFSEKKQGR